MGDESDTEGVTPGRRSILAGIAGTFAGLGAVQTASGQEEPEWPVGGPDEVDYTRHQVIADDSGTIELSVPTAWDDVDATPVGIGPSVWASPDIEGYGNSWVVPGIEVTVTTEARIVENEPDEVLDTFADFGMDCGDGGRQRFDSRGYEFLAQTWAACGDDGTMFVAMVATPETDPPHTVLVGAQLVTVQDIVALAAASGSLEVDTDALEAVS